MWIFLQGQRWKLYWCEFCISFSCTNVSSSWTFEYPFNVSKSWKSELSTFQKFLFQYPKLQWCYLFASLVVAAVDTVTRFRTREGIATGSNSHKTAKWSYLDQPVNAIPLNFVGRPWPFGPLSLAMTSSLIWNYTYYMSIVELVFWENRRKHTYHERWFL